MTNLSNKIEKVEKEFDELYIKVTPNNESDFIKSKAIQELFDFQFQKEKLAVKSFLISAIKEAIQEAFEMTRMDERSHEEHFKKEELYCCLDCHDDGEYKKVLEAIKIKQDNYLSTNL